MYAIIGITGNTGKIVASALLTQGKKVRGLFRDLQKAREWEEKGVEPIVGELSDLQPLKRLFDGSEGAYIMTPTYFTAEDMFAENTRDVAVLRQAALEVALPKAVLLSSIGAQHSSGTGAILKLHEMEQAFSDLPISCASIRAAWFMENFTGLVNSVKESGVLPSFLNPLDRAIPMIATEDIGTLAATLLVEKWNGQRHIELEHSKRYSPKDVAAAFASVLGRDVVAQVLGRSQWASAYQSWGLTIRSSEAMSEMLDGFNRQWIQFEGNPAEHTYGNTSLEEVLRHSILLEPVMNFGP